MRFLHLHLSPEMLPGPTGRSKERPFPHLPGYELQHQHSPSQMPEHPCGEGPLPRTRRSRARSLHPAGATRTEPPAPKSPHQPPDIHHLSKGPPELSFPNKPQTKPNPRGTDDPVRRSDQGSRLLSSEAEPSPSPATDSGTRPASLAHAGVTPAPRPRDDYEACESED